MQQIPQTAYDKAVAMFSPDGRLIQVEYAREAIKRGTTAIGIKTKEGVVLLSNKNLRTKLAEPESIEKIMQIDDHIGAAMTGMTADGRTLIERARVEAQINVATYDEPIGVETLTKKICDLEYLYTQSGSNRPFGASLLIAGMENNIPRLFETDPSGAFIEYLAVGIGNYREEAIEILEKYFKKDMKMESAIKLGLKVLESIYPNITSDSIEIVTINEKYEKMQTEGIGIYLGEN